MQADAFPHLFTPLAIGGVTLRNRLVMLPMGTRWARDGMVTDEDIAWHRARARGGVAAIVTGGTLVHPTTKLRSLDAGLIDAWNESGLDAQRRRVDAVHGEGALIFGQLLHLGRETIGSATDLAQWAPSPLRSPIVPNVPHEMSVAEIREVVESFARCARLQQEAGYDGVEIHGAHGYLVGQFLSRASNVRNDSYGGTKVEQRMRFLREILEAVRDLCGNQIVLGVRLSADEETPTGLTVADTAAIAEACESGGLVDYLSLTVGMRGNYVKDNTVPVGVGVERIATVSAATGLPVVAASRITTPALAESIVAEGRAQAVGMARALIADPRWPEKARTGRADSIRPCVGFVQDCRLAPGGALCGVNAAAGRETRWGDVPTSDSPLRLVIVGGGPAGLEAARVARKAGHDVVLFERDDVLGGQWRQASKAPWRADFRELITYFERSLAELGVDVRLAIQPEVQTLQAESPDAIVLATGSQPVAPPFRGDATTDVMSAFAALDLPEGAIAGRQTVLVDDGSAFWQVFSAAEHLARAGASLTLVTPLATVGANIPHESIGGLHQRLRGLGVRYRAFATVERVGDGSVTLLDTITAERETVPADLVVMQAGHTANSALAKALVGCGTAMHMIGDCVAPRRITDALFDANRVVREELGRVAQPT